MDVSEKVEIYTMPVSNRNIGKIFNIAWPMLFTAFVVSFFQNGQIWILSNTETPFALYSLAMLQPFQFLFIAILECFAITNQVFSARSKNDWPKKKVINSSFILSLICTGLLIIISGVSWAFSEPLQNLAGGESPELFSKLLPLYFLSLIPFLIFEMGNSALRGQGKTFQSMLLMIIYIVTNLSICYLLFTRYQFGISSIFISNIFATIIVLPISWILMIKVCANGDDPQPGAFIPRLIAILTDAGIPVFFSMVIVFASSIVIFPILSNFDAGYASGFLVVIKLRALFIIPAVAIGSAVAIFINQQLKKTDISELRKLLSQTLIFLAGGYIVFTIVAYFNQEFMVNILSENLDVRKSAYLVVAFLIPTFFTTSIVASMQTILEQLGRGKRVLFFTFIIEILMVTTILLFKKNIMYVDEILFIIIIFSFIYLLIFLMEYVFLLKKLNDKNVL